MAKSTDTNPVEASDKTNLPEQSDIVSDASLDASSMGESLDSQNFGGSADTSIPCEIADVLLETSSLETITAERDALKEKLLRALADTENMRRRSEREAETARKYGHTQFARDLVGAIDNLARALASAPADKAILDDSVQSLLTGIELSWTEIQTAIEKHGVRQINPLSEKFDYNFHQAMFEVPTNDQPPGMVLEVVQHGYALHDRLLRPAMVGVSKALDVDEKSPSQN
jgi:molecular chaperone GrpE